jgi:uncharacterized protein YbjT (DUF2867 family)
VADRIAVAGGTGVVGRHVVEALTRSGCEPVVLARSAGVDLVSGAGLDAALEGVRAVVDVSNLSSQRRAASVGFFTAATASLLRAGARAGVRHHVELSIVGVDRVDTGYYAGKRARRRGPGGDVPATVLRATQFHEFAEQVLVLATGRWRRCRACACSPWRRGRWGEHLVQLVLDARRAGTRARGPQGHELTDLVRRPAADPWSAPAGAALKAPTAASRAVTGGRCCRPGPARAASRPSTMAAGVVTA